MPHFHWKQNPPKIGKQGEEISQGGEMHQVQDDLNPKPVEVGQPTAVNAKEKAAPVKKNYCIACTPQKAFGTVGVMSMHFKKDHSDLYEDKNSFREYLDKKEE